MISILRSNCRAPANMHKRKPQVLPIKLQELQLDSECGSSEDRPCYAILANKPQDVRIKGHI